MIKAIVYQSDTGFTKKYAMMLMEKTGLPSITLQEAKKVLQSKDQIIYLGWVLANTISGYKKANRKYLIRAIGAVGLAESGEEYQEVLKKQNKTAGKPLFYMTGGLDKSKQKGIKKFMFSMFVKYTVQKINKKEISEITDEETKNIYCLQHGCDFVSLENLQDFIKLYGKNKE